VRFSDFLRATVLTSAASASVLAAVTVAGGTGSTDTRVVPVGVGWWVIATAIGVVLGLAGFLRLGLHPDFLARALA